VSGAAPAHGSIMRGLLFAAALGVGCSAAPRVVVLADGQSPSSLAVHDGRVYWTNTDGVMSCAAAGCDAPSRIARADAPSSIAVSDAGVYFTAAGAVWRALDGDVRVLESKNDAWAVALGPSQVYWTTNATAGPVLACPLDGCASAPTHVAGGDASFAIATDDTSVYWSDWNAVWTCAFEGCTNATPLAAVAGHVALAVDDANVYWAYADEGVIFSCSKRACLEPTVVATHQPGTTALASDGARLYWTTKTDVMRCSASACATPESIAALDAPATKGAIALDAASVYFVSGDRVEKTDK
jgi:hypothetical protein